MKKTKVFKPPIYGLYIIPKNEGNVGSHGIHIYIYIQYIYILYQKSTVEHRRKQRATYILQEQMFWKKTNFPFPTPTKKTGERLGGSHLYNTMHIKTANEDILASHKKRLASKHQLGL